MRFRKILLSALIVLQVSCDGQNQASVSAVAPDQTGELEVGNLTLRVAPAAGGRISSLLYQGQELLAQPSALDADNWGSTLWVSPQESWGWPPPKSFDALPYKLEQMSTSLVLTGPVDHEKTGLQIVKKIHLLGADRLRIDYALVNPSDQRKQSAAWEVTRVPIKGLVLFAQESTPLRWSFGGFPYQSYGDITWIDLRDSELSEGKLNVNGRGWLAWVDGRTLLVKRFTDIEEKQQAPNEAELQIYISPRGYMELEAQSAFDVIQPQESLSFSTEWQVLTLPAHIDVSVDSPSLLTFLQTLGLKL